MNESVENINGRLSELELLIRYIESNGATKSDLLMFIANRSIILSMDMDLIINEMTGKLEKKESDNHE